MLEEPETMAAKQTRQRHQQARVSIRRTIGTLTGQRLGLKRQCKSVRTHQCPLQTRLSTQRIGAHLQAKGLVSNGNANLRITQVWLCVSCHSTKILPVGTPVAILGLYSKALSTRNTHSHTHGGSREDNINQRTEHTQQRQHQTSMPRNTSNIITPHGQIPA